MVHVPNVFQRKTDKAPYDRDAQSRASKQHKVDHLLRGRGLGRMCRRDRQVTRSVWHCTHRGAGEKASGGRGWRPRCAEAPGEGSA